MIKRKNSSYAEEEGVGYGVLGAEERVEEDEEGKREAEEEEDMLESLR